VLAADGVASPEHLIVGAPAVTDLFFYLLLDVGEGVLVYTADPGCLVLDPE
jgi:hypothetical protein